MSYDLDQAIEDARREEAELMNPQLRTDRIERELEHYQHRAIRGDTDWVEHLDDGEAVEAIAALWKAWLSSPEDVIPTLVNQLSRLYKLAMERHKEALNDE